MKKKAKQSLVCLVIIILVSTIVTVINLFDNVTLLDSSINRVSIVVYEKSEDLFNSGNQYSSYKLKKVNSNLNNYFVMECNFTVKYNDNTNTITRKAKLYSDNLTIVYDNANYNICESPILLEKDKTYEFKLKFFIKKDEYTSKLSDKELISYIKKNLTVKVVTEKQETFFDELFSDGQ